MFPVAGLKRRALIPVSTFNTVPHGFRLLDGRDYLPNDNIGSRITAVRPRSPRRRRSSDETHLRRWFGPSGGNRLRPCQVC